MFLLKQYSQHLALHGYYDMIILFLLPSLLCCLMKNLLNKDLHTLYILGHDLFRFDVSIFILICVDEEMEKFQQVVNIYMPEHVVYSNCEIYI